MTITHRQVSTVTKQSAPAGGGTIAASWPSATTAGSLLIAVIGASTSNATWDAPTPQGVWTQAVQSPDNSAAGADGYIYYCLNAASQSGAQTWDVSGNSTMDIQLCLYEVDIDGKTQALDVTVQALISQAAATTAPNSGLSGAASQGDEYVFGLITNRNLNTITSPLRNGTATGGTWTQWNTSTSSAATAANRNTISAFDAQITGAGTLGCSGTLSTARGWAALLVSFALTSGAVAPRAVPWPRRSIIAADAGRR